MKRNSILFFINQLDPHRQNLQDFLSVDGGFDLFGDFIISYWSPGCCTLTCVRGLVHYVFTRVKKNGES